MKRKSWKKALAVGCAAIILNMTIGSTVFAGEINKSTAIALERDDSSCSTLADEAFQDLNEDVSYESGVRDTSDADQIVDSTDVLEADVPNDDSTWEQDRDTEKKVDPADVFEVEIPNDDSTWEHDISEDIDDSFNDSVAASDDEIVFEDSDFEIIAEDLVGGAPNSKGNLIADNLFYNYTYYNQDLAKVCAELCDNDEDLSAYFPEGQMQQYYTEASNGEHIFKFTIGYKTITTNGSQKNLVSIVLNGTSTIDEVMKDLLKDLRHFPFEGEEAFQGPYKFQASVINGLNMFFNKHEGVKDHPIVYLVTGYSLGGAAANLLGAKLTRMNKQYGSDKVFVYTFGAIKAITNSSNVEIGYGNIFNIYNYYDSFGPHGYWASLDVSDPYYKFGRTLLCNFDNQTGPLENHAIENYRNYIETGNPDVPKNIGQAGILDGGQRWDHRDASDIPALHHLYTLTIYGEGALADHPPTDHVEGRYYKYNKCLYIERVYIQDGITRIGKYQFTNRPELAWIYIPKSVTSIADNAFIDCGLYTVNFGGTREQWNAISVNYDKNIALKNATIHCKDDEEPNDDNPTGVQQYGDIRLGYSITASFDADSGSLVIYSDGGRLPSDWASKADIDKTLIKSINVCGTLYFPDNASELFRGCSNLNDLSLNNVNTLTVANMEGMFRGCKSLKNLDLSSFNTSSVKKMNDMFLGCSELTTLDLSSFNTSNVKYMYRMFEGCSGLTSLDLSNFNTSNVSSMNRMFEGCSGLTSLDLSNFNTSNVSYMASMFDGCSGLTSLDLSSFNTSNVTNMGSMFYGCSGLTSLDLSNFNTSNMSFMDSMFYGCSGLTSLDLSNFNTSNVSSMYRIFDGCSGLTSLDLSNFNTSNVKTMFYMFLGCHSLETLDLSSFDTSKVENMDCMFDGCKNLKTLDLRGFNTSNVWIMYGMFGGCSSLKNLDLSRFNTQNVRNMQCMFGHCSSLKNLDLSSFDTSKVESMWGMFMFCSSLETLDLSNFNTSNVTDMGSMFSGCSGLTSLNLSSFNTSKVTDMGSVNAWGGMFAGCSGLTSLDLSNFNTSNVTNMNSMFTGCSGLTSLDLSNFNTSNVEDMHEMFRECSSLKNLDLSGFDTSKLVDTDIDYMLYGCNRLSILKTPKVNPRRIELPKMMYDDVGNEYTCLNYSKKSITLRDKFSIENSSVGGVSLSYGYSGKSYTPAVTVKLGGMILTKGTDYTVKYENNVKPGTAKITVTGKGKYTGTKTKTFEIVDCVSSVVSGKTYLLIPKNNAKTAVCAVGGKMVNNTKVYITDRGNSESQKFKAVKNSDGTWKFINAKCELALAVQQNSSALGAGLVLYDQTTRPAQNWKLSKKADNSFAIINSVTGYSIAMSDKSAVKGTTLSMAETASVGLQRFYIVETSAVSAPFDGTKSIRAAKNKNFAVNIASSSKEDGANVSLYTYTNSNARKFKIIYSGGGYYRLVNVNSGLCLTIKDNSNADGANIIQSKWKGYSSQRWKITKNSDGTVTITNMLGTVLHLLGNRTVNNTNIHARKAASTTAQKWYFN